MERSPKLTKLTGPYWKHKDSFTYLDIVATIEFLLKKTRFLDSSMVRPYKTSSNEILKKSGVEKSFDQLWYSSFLLQSRLKKILSGANDVTRKRD